MISWLRTFTLLYVCVSVLTQQSEKDIESLIDEVFNSPNPSDPAANRGSTNTGPNLNPGTDTVLPGVESDCICVPFYLCNNGTINKNGEGIIDIRIDGDSGPCGNYIQVCCHKDQIEEKPITTSTQAPIHKGSSACGYRHPDGVGFRITGEDEAQFGEFPWMVAILREEEVDGNPTKLNVYQCGGALIHPQVVVTAAHCVSGKGKNYKIRAGEWDTQHTDELLPHQDMDVQKVISHSQYYAGALYNDIALLILNGPVTITDNVDVICLPAQNHAIQSARCFATGWGKDTFGKKGKYQVILKKIDLPVVPNPQCQEKLRTTRLGKFFELHKSFICAGGEPGKDTCKGDGGSPLICPIPGEQNRYFQAGIVAWGVGCGDKEIPGVYVNVALFRDWIDDQLKSNGIDGSSYRQ